ncbi:MAG: hypothetical protein AMS18_16365 [Gemmatimonas sp. SG8_17]|nr:MAG: hypothetical protein AMS18_16365 [Gemmatimonas sp. SG8_17]
MKSLIVAVSLAAAALQTLRAQDVAVQIDDFISQYHQLRQFNGAVLVGKLDSVVYEAGFGLANMDWGIPNTPDTKFRVGSVTKQFTATVILKLVEEGKLRLDGKITDYLPDYPRETGDRITIHHLLTHSSGIPSYTGFPDFQTQYMRNPFTPDSFVTVFSGMELEFEPGTTFRYNNSGYFLLGVIIEHVTGLPFHEVLRQMVLDPLGLEDTGYDHNQEIIQRRASGYAKTLTGYENAEYLDMSLPYAAGSLYSTPRDLFKWDQLLRAGEVFAEPHSAESMFTPHLQNYGYGWVIRDLPIGNDGKKVKLVEHGGGINGFITGFWRLVDDGYTVIVMDNTEGSKVTAVQQGIVNILYGEPAVRAKHSVAETLLKIIEERGIEAAVQRHSELKAAGSEDYDFGQAELNALGYHYLDEGDIATATTLLELNVEAYPDSFNTYDSLAEALLRAADTAGAAANYRKSVELNPSNENGKRMLAQLGVELDAGLGDAVTVSPEVLLRYAGDYELRSDLTIKITFEDGVLLGQATGQGKVELVATSETHFFVEVVEAQITFDVADDGTVNGLTLYHGGASLYAAKVR